MSKSNFIPPRRGTPGRLQGGGTRAKNDQETNPPNQVDPDNSNRQGAG